MGRTWVGEGLCSLVAGRALGTEATIYNGLRNLFGVSDVERAEAQFALGLARYETGDVKGGIELIGIARNRSDARLRATIHAYLDAVGIKHDR
jgi:hypothetical protein